MHTSQAAPGGSAKHSKLPESLAQARRFEQFHRAAARALLCTTCASQHAYGRQYGFRAVNPPCESCRLVMQAWPKRKPGGWAALPRESTPTADVATPVAGADLAPEAACTPDICTSEAVEVPQQG
jgi:DMSO/TMAO reductase YedYZ molybdopterin-dependent catalytic subunit